MFRAPNSFPGPHDVPAFRRAFADFRANDVK
jgi:hypothetical protein